MSNEHPLVFARYTISGEERVVLREPDFRLLLAFAKAVLGKDDDPDLFTHRLQENDDG